MSSVREAADDLLAERPDLESDLRELLAVDDREEAWTFDDVPLDSGTFGELVSRGVVVEDGDGYELADPRAVRASLGDDESEREADRRDRPTLPSVSLPSFSRREAGALGGVLAFLVVMRAYVFPSVFRGGHVVLPSNDPYYYRYWVERLAAEATGVFDFSVLSGLPGAVAKGEPLMVGTLWWVTNLLGGGDAAGWVLAWYPVVSALVVGLLVYALAVRVSGDRRVGLAAVVFLAVIPAFAFRTGLGFADHHAFDYPWVALTALALVGLADVDRERLSTVRPWLAAVVLGVAVAGQVMAWEAGPLLVAALGVYVAVRAAVDLRADRSPLVAAAPILAGLALASVLSHLAHAGFGWHTDMVTYAPALALVGAAGVTLVGEAVRRAGMPAFVLGGAEVAGALSALALLQTLLPGVAGEVNERVGTLLFNAGAAETQSLFAGGPAGFFLGPVFELGFAWLLGLPMLALVGWRAYRRDRPAWLVVATYGAYFLALAALQRRFVGELAPFFAVLAGYGFVAFAAKLDVLAPLASADAGGATGGRPRRADGGRPGPRAFELPGRETMTTLAVLLLFLTSAGAVQTGVRNEQVRIDDDKFEAAVWMDGYAAEQAWEYPQDYVLTKWGRNRMYNYFVNGEAEGYGFAANNYERFLAARDPGAEYRKLRDRVGFAVTKNLDVSDPAEETNYARLHQRFGSAGAGANGTGHFRAVYASGDGSVKVFTLVPGANVTGTAAPNGTVTVSKSVEIEGATFDYRRVAETGADGSFSVTVPHPGTYAVGNGTVTVPESAVRNGGNVSVGA